MGRDGFCGWVCHSGRKGEAGCESGDTCPSRSGFEEPSKNSITEKLMLIAEVAKQLQAADGNLGSSFRVLNRYTELMSTATDSAQEYFMEGSGCGPTGKGPGGFTKRSHDRNLQHASLVRVRD